MSAGFKRGARVEVRSAAEILRTLDDDGTLDRLPFMAEMIKYCGGQFTVDARASKVCDTMNGNLTSRRISDTVLLSDLRCDGSGHDECQNDCLLYWKEAWLRPA